MKKKIVYNSPVILTYALVSLAVLVVSYLTGGWVGDSLFMVYRGSLADPLFYFRLVSHALGHSSFAHYAGNFTMILLIGPMVEERYGSKQLLVMMAFTALITGILQVVFFPEMGLMGASGIAFMLIILGSATNFKRGEVPLTLLVAVILYIGQEVLDGIVAQDNVSQFAHIVGGLCGAIFGLNRPEKH